MKNRWMKKSLALLLALVMCLSLLPASALAEGAAEEPLPEEPVETVGEAAPEETEALPEEPSEDVPEEPTDETSETPEEPSEEVSEAPEEPTAETPEEPSEEAHEEPSEEAHETPGEQPEEPADETGDGEEPTGEISALGMPGKDGRLPFTEQSYSFTYINPLYADVIDESDIPMPGDTTRYRDALCAYVAAAHGLSEEEPDPAIHFAESIEEASAEVKAQFVARNEEISVYYAAAADSDWDALFQAIFNGAMVHTGNPREGDYLQYQYGGWGANIDVVDWSEDTYYCCFVYTPAYYTTAAQESAMDGKVGAILGQLSLGGKSDYQKLQAIYDYLCANVVYDYTNLNDDEYMLKYTGYAALVNGTAVCQGISVAFYRLSLTAGVDARIVTSDQMCHAWNIARCQGAYYELDATWNLSETGFPPYWFFLKGSTYWLREHTLGDGYSTLGDQLGDPAFGAYTIPAEDCVPATTFTVHYDANGGENAPADQVKTQGAALVLSAQVPTRDGYTFRGWALSADAAEPVYLPGASYTDDADVTLYAVWEEAVTIVDSGTCGAQGDNLTWALDSRGTLTISGEGDMADYWYDSPWYSHREEIRELSIQFGVTSIGRCAFVECAGPRRVILPDSVIRLGTRAFMECSGLEEITLSENLVSIGFMALNDTALESLFIPASVTDIDSGAFWSSSNLLRFDVAAENPVYKSVDGVVFSKDGTRLEQYPDGREGAYTVPAGVTAIGDYAFYGSDGLTAITFPGTLTSIGYRAFEGSGLTVIHLPASVSAVGGRAFAGIWEASITVEASSPYFTAVDGVLYSKDMTELVAATRALQGSFTIPASVTRVCEGACTFSSLSTLAIPASVSVIEQESFYGCYQLTTIRFEHGAEDPLTIEERAFHAYYGPTEILVPDKDLLHPAISGYDWAGSGRDVTLVSVELYPITYHLNCGTNNPDNPETYTSLDTVTLADPTREGYAFAGWYDNEAFTGEPVTALAGGVPAAVWAKWEPIAYTVRFDPNGGIGIMASLTDCRTDEPRELPACGFTRTGCAFAGWNTAPDGSGTTYQPGDSVVNLCSEPNGVVTLYALWAPCTYYIAFDPNGGDGGDMQPLETLYGQSTVLPAPGFTKTGYTFTGWNTQADGKGTAYADGAAVLNLSSTEGAVVTLYAQWKPNAYTVRFDANGGTGSMAAQAMTYDKAAALKANVFKKASNTFLGWATEPDALAPQYLDKQKVENLTAEPDGEAVLYAVWAKYSYQIVFNPNGGTGDMADDGGLCTYDGSYVLPACTFTRPGFDFLGWATTAKGKVVYQDGQTVSGLSTKNGAVVTLYAVWSAHTYRVVFEPNGGTGTTKAMSCTCGKVVTLTANAFKRAGYSFAGWNTAADGSGEAYANKARQSNFATENGAVLTLYAQWTPVEYKIAYKNIAAGDHNPNPPTYTVEDAVALAAPARPGCEFLGWYSDAKLTKPVTGIAEGTTGARTFYAKWSGTAYTYGIVFDPNGGTGTMKAMANLSCGKTYTLTANAFKRAGYSFAGWNTAPDGSSAAYANKAKVGGLSEEDGATVTLYAQWMPVTYKITYKNATVYDGNTNPETFTVEDTVALAPVTRPGCVFEGWFSDAKFKKPVAQIEAGHVGNLTLYAKWSGKAATYTIAFNGNGATSGKMASMTKRVCGTGYALTANAFKRTGYSFAGWNTAPDGSGTAYANKEKVANLCTVNGGTATLYAQWAPIVYTITYKNLNQARLPEQTSYTIEDGFELPVPVKAGQVFLGWYSTAGFKAGTEVRAIEPGTTGNKTFYAKWMLLTNAAQTA